jgi:hypothetical protein
MGHPMIHRVGTFSKEVYMANNTETKELELSVHTSDPETGEYLDSDTYYITVPKDLDPDTADLFPYFWEQNGDEFPDEEPGVDVTIDEWKEV